MSDWFRSLTGVRESDYAATQAQFELDGDTLLSRANGRTFHIGTLTTPSLGELRDRARDVVHVGAPAPRVSVVSADVIDLHRQPALHGAVFQVASQFNLLEMVGPDVTPEDGVTRYWSDRTQGPACAVAAAGATIYRNYFMPVGDGLGQTRDRQVDCLADLGAALGNADDALWTMRNGYALCTEAGLASIDARLAASTPAEIDALRDLLRVGVHADVEVTATGAPEGQRVTQVFCSALPVSYTSVPQAKWTSFATLVLEGAYEATLWAAALEAWRCARPTVFLTMLGGGAFGNDPAWIHAAIRRAVAQVRGVNLDVRIVSRGAPSPAVRALVEELNA